MSRRTKVINYLSNKILLKEIHKSKNTYSEFLDPKYENYDIIVDSVNDINEEIIEQAKKNRAIRLNDEHADVLFAGGMTNKQITEYMKVSGIMPETIPLEDLVFRVTSDDHIPEAKNKKDETIRAKTNFPPFQHHAFVPESESANRRNDTLTMVGKSHFKNGVFSKDHGKITNQLAMSLMKLTDKYSNKSNWRGYTWLDEMKGHAIVRLCQIALQFNEAKSQNPFAWYTTVINRSFTYVLNNEKQHADFKNNLIAETGLEQTFNKQADQDVENYYANRGEENPYKKMITNKPLNFYKKKPVAAIPGLPDAIPVTDLET